MRNIDSFKYVLLLAISLAAFSNLPVLSAEDKSLPDQAEKNSVQKEQRLLTQSGATLSGRKRQKGSLLLSQNGQMPVQQGQMMPMQSGQMPMQQGQLMPVQNGQMPMQHGQMMPVQNGQMPMQQGQMMPMQQGQMMPMQSGQMPMQQGQMMPVQNGQMPMQQGQMPMQSGLAPGAPSLFAFPDKIVDFNTARSAKTEIDLEGAQFLDAAVERMHMTARNLDMQKGVVGSLDFLVLGGHFQDFTVDQLRITSTTPLAFSTDTLLNHRSFEFTTPAVANVSAVVSQISLNKFLASPRTLQLLSAGAQNHIPSFLSELVGAALQVQFQSASAQFLASNRVQIDVLADINVLKTASRLPITVNTQLGLANGWVNLSDTQISTSGQAISPELSSMVVGRINNLAKWGTRNDDIQFAFTQINVVPGNRFELVGTAQLKRLRFGT